MSNIESHAWYQQISKTKICLHESTRTEINFNTKEQFFAPTFEIMEQKWLSQELFLKPQTDIWLDWVAKLCS